MFRDSSIVPIPDPAEAAIISPEHRAQPKYRLPKSPERRYHQPRQRPPPRATSPDKQLRSSKSPPTPARVPSAELAQRRVSPDRDKRSLEVLRKLKVSTDSVSEPVRTWTPFQLPQKPEPGVLSKMGAARGSPKKEEGQKPHWGSSEALRRTAARQAARLPTLPDARGQPLRGRDARAPFDADSTDSSFEGEEHTAEAKTFLSLTSNMKGVLTRVDRMVVALGRDQKYVIEGEEDTGHTASLTDPAQVEELKEIVQVLLKDITRQTQHVKHLEQQDQKKDLVVKKSVEELERIKTGLEKMTADRDHLAELLVEKDAEKAALEERVAQFQTMAKRSSRHGSVIAASVPSPSKLPSTTAGSAEAAKVERPLSAGGRENPSKELLAVDDIEEEDDFARWQAIEQSQVLLPMKYQMAPRGESIVVVCLGVQRYAELMENYAYEMSLAMTTYLDVVHETLNRHNGYEVKICDDEILVVFETISDACNFACEVQLDLVEQTWPNWTHPDVEVEKYAKIEDEAMSSAKKDPTFLWAGLRVRMGMHVGPAVVDGDPRTQGVDYRGNVVFRAMLLKRVSYGGMVAISKDIYAAVLADQTLFARLSLTHHCKLPTVVVAESVVFCMLPLELEQRLTQIHQALRRGAAVEAEELDDAPTEIESMLGTFRKRAIGDADFVNTPDGPLGAAACVEPDYTPVITATRLPSGDIALLCIRIEWVRELRSMLSEKHVAMLIKMFTNVVNNCLPVFGGQFVGIASERYFCVFRTCGAALKCALSINHELTARVEWPEEILELNPLHLGPLRWRNVLEFNGPRACFGVHPCCASPSWDPMTNSIVYLGEDPLIASRLASLAKGGQVLLLEKHAYNMLVRLQTRPFFYRMAIQTYATEETMVELCVAMQKEYIGRFFIYFGFEGHADWRNQAAYREIRDTLRREELYWSRRAAITIPTPAASDADDVMTVQQYEARASDIAIAHSLAAHLAHRVRTSGDTIDKRAIRELTLAENAIMALEDTTLYGCSLSLPTATLDTFDLRVLGKETDQRETGELAASTSPEESIGNSMSVSFRSTANTRSVSFKLPGGNESTREGPPADQAELQRADAAAAVQNEVLMLHRGLRTILPSIQNFLESAVDPTVHPVTEQEVLNKISDKYNSLPSTARAEWNDLLQLALDQKGEEAQQKDSQRLCRSVWGHVCHHFSQMAAVVHRLIARPGDGVASKKLKEGASPSPRKSLQATPAEK